MPAPRTPTRPRSRRRSRRAFALLPAALLATAGSCLAATELARAPVLERMVEEAARKERATATAGVLQR